MNVDLPPALRDWLLRDSDPSVRAFVLSDLQGRPPGDPEVLAARSEIGRSGWAGRILAEQLPSGQWSSPGTGAHDLYVPKYTAANWRLLLLAELGATRTVPGVARAAELLLERWGGPTGDLGGEGSEVCVTGNAVRYLTLLGYGDRPEVARSLDWLVSSQRADGGWHCAPSEHGTLDAWEAMAAFAVLHPDRRTAPIRRAIERGAEFYLERGLLNEGGESYAPWGRLHYPNHYYYDYLVGLDFLTRLGYGTDARLAPALDRLEGARNAHGSWNLEAAHPDLPAEEEYQPRTPVYPIVLEPVGTPSRWITARALAVLARAGRLPPSPRG